MNTLLLFVKQHRIACLLIAMSLFCAAMSLARFVATGSTMFLFLNWNLFLAFIPWAASSAVMTSGSKNKVVLAALVLVWIVFFPNAPYIITDFVHLRISYSAPAWFDILLIFSFAWTGLVYGFLSLIDIEILLAKYISRRMTTCLIVVFIFIVSFGIYLGRYLRWNSWDILSNPLGLLADIVHRIANPMSHPRTWAMTIFFGIVLNMVYFSIHAMRSYRRDVSV